MPQVDLRTGELYHYGVKGMKWDQPGRMAKSPEELRAANPQAYNTYQQKTPAVKATAKTRVSKPQRKAQVSSADRKLVDDVIRGKYGNGDSRKKALGSKYNLVQDMVNTRLVKGYKPRYSVQNGKPSAKPKTKAAKKRKSRLSPQEKAKRAAAKTERAKKTAARKALADKKRVERGKIRAQKAAERAAQKAQKVRSRVAKDAERKRSDSDRMSAAARKKKLREIKNIRDIKHGEVMTVPTAEESFLAHYGVKGMKWGIRRERDWSKGGRVAKAKISSLNTEENKSKARKAYALATKGENEPYKSMSDDELKTKLKRMRMENEYRNLMLAEAKHEKGQTLVGRGAAIIKAIKNDEPDVLQVNMDAIAKNHILPELKERAKKKAGI